jgi:glyoxylase-like metal-dependent hydrolase (beta-lactamase superfamily II)
MSVEALLTDYPDGITAIDTQYLRRWMDASHLIVHGGRGAFVDVGTNFSIPTLLEAIEARGLKREAIDYVLLTHVHLDHAGGAGLIMQSLPNAKAVIHPRGARHMVDPSKLIAGATQVYGEEGIRRLYGTLLPIPENRIVIADDGMNIMLGGDRRLELIHTPGHALHHYAIIDHSARAIFSGDNFGISFREFDTAHGEFIFPTTSPVQFDPDAMHATIDRLMSYQPKAMYLTHYSRVNDLARLARDLHAAVDAYVELARRHHGKPDRGALIRKDMAAWFDAALDRHGYTGNAIARRELLESEIDINSQGLEVWLDRRAGAGRE